MKSYQQYCGLALALDRIGGRWTLLVVRELLTGEKRYTDLRSGLPGIASNLLTKRLKALEAAGIVEKKTLPPPAASTVYALTDLGRALDEVVHALVLWGGNFMTARSEQQDFQPHWLAVALGAMAGEGVTPDSRLVVEVAMPEGETKVRFDTAGVRPVAPDEASDVRLSGSAQLVLGLAAGELDWETATASGLEVTGPPSKIELLRSLFSGMGR